MHELIYLDDAITALLKEQDEDLEAYGCSIPEMFDGDRAVEVITKLPTIDATQVIRCKDCKHWDKTWIFHPPAHHYCPFIDYMTSESFYCANAERRPDADE